MLFGCLRAMGVGNGREAGALDATDALEELPSDGAPRQRQAAARKAGASGRPGFEGVLQEM